MNDGLFIGLILLVFIASVAPEALGMIPIVAFSYLILKMIGLIK